MSSIETRAFHLALEPLRPPAEARDGTPGGRVVVGHAAVYESLSEDLGGFSELIRPGAFTDVLRDPHLDVTALFNHDPNYLLGRTTSGTLKLAEDSKGLAVRLALSDATYARDISTAMDRGDLCSMSFAFTVGVDVWRKAAGTTIREIVKFARLFDVSVVTTPAYPAAAATIRALAPARVLDARSLEDMRKQLAATAPMPPPVGWRHELLRRRMQLAQTS